MVEHLDPSLAVLDACDEVPDVRRSLPVNPGHAFETYRNQTMSSPMEQLREAMDLQHLEVLERLGQQDQVLKSLEEQLKRPLLRPRDKLDPVLAVKPTSSVGSSPSRLSSSRGTGSRSVTRRRRSSRHSSRKGSFTPTFFTTYTQADLALKHGAQYMHAVRSRRKFASLKSENIDNEVKEPLAQRILQQPAFDAFFAFTVIANTVYIGFDVQHSINYPNSSEIGFHIGHYIFTLAFIVELAIRLAAQGLRFFCSEDWMWAALDTFIVISSLWDIVMDILYFWRDNGVTQGFSEMSSFKAFRIIRITRIVKAVRLMRIFRFIMALRMLITSIMHTLKSLFWAMVLLVLIMYAFAVLLAQVVNDHMLEQATGMGVTETQAVDKYFGSVQNTMLTLFMSISNGVSWEHVLAPLRVISLAWVFVYLFFIAFTYFAVLNVVTGVFCQSAIDSAQNDHAAIVQSILENKEAHLAKIKTLFQSLGGGGKEEEMNFITFPVFEEKINTPEVRDYFESLRLDIWDAWTFFKMLDMDGGGTIPLDEFLLGCLRLRGTARAVDVGRVIYDQQWVMKNFGKFQTHVEVELQTLKETLESLVEELAAPMFSSRSSAGSRASSVGSEQPKDPETVVLHTWNTSKGSLKPPTP